MQARGRWHRSLDIRLAPQGIVSAVVPNDSAIASGALGIDLLTEPMRRAGVMEAIRTGRLMAQGPMLVEPEGVTALIMRLPIYIDNVNNPNEAFGCATCACARMRASAAPAASTQRPVLACCPLVPVLPLLVGGLTAGAECLWCCVRGCAMHS